MKRTPLLTASAILLCLAAGAALTQILGDPGRAERTDAARSLSATDCPEANAALAMLTGHGYDNFGSDCPSSNAIEQVVAESRPRAEVVAACRATLRSDPDHGGCEGVLEFAARYAAAYGLQPN